MLPPPRVIESNRVGCGLHIKHAEERGAGTRGLELLEVKEALREKKTCTAIAH